jgi:hypothetical protein
VGPVGAEAFEFRLPEVFAGFDRDSTTVAVEYPTASATAGLGGCRASAGYPNAVGTGRGGGSDQVGALPPEPDRSSRVAARATVIWLAASGFG